jgi:secondary thiamine-phosphate synthase enzyme
MPTPSGHRSLSATLRIRTEAPGTQEITAEINAALGNLRAHDGLCFLFVHHTSASLIVTENAAPAVQADLQRFFDRLVPEGESLYAHRDEGLDDMPAHIRSVLTATSLTLPVKNGRCDLGTWQGVFLWEHRRQPHQRRVSVSFIGDGTSPKGEL